MGDEAERLLVVALEDVAAEDEAGGTGVHRLARLLQHGFVAGLLAARDQQQRPAGRPDHRVDGLLRRELLAVGLRDAVPLAWLGEVHLDHVRAEFARRPRGIVDRVERVPAALAVDGRAARVGPMSGIPNRSASSRTRRYWAKSRSWPGVPT